MNYAKIKHFDIANGEGVRMSLFVSGCKFQCKGCFNEEAWDFNYGNVFSSETHSQLIKLLSNENVSGLSILGGDPFWQDDDGLQELIMLVKDAKSIGKNVWAWTGFKYEWLVSNGSELQKALLRNIDVLVDGKFDYEKRDLRLKWMGSSNQRVIDVSKSIESCSVHEHVD